jgi:transcriptional regulator with XRE-family HTH domain
VDGLYKEFGRLLKAARKDARLTQNEVAGRVGLSRTSITNIERGTQHIPLHQLFLLASAVGVTPAALLPDQKAAIEELVPPRALRALRADKDEEELDFAARILAKQSPREPRSKRANG